MTNKQIIDAINRYCVNNEEPQKGLDGSEIIYTMLSHSYFFVTPGEKSKKLMEEIVTSITKSVEVGINHYFDLYQLTSLEFEIFNSVAKSTLSIVRKFFDKDYFENQCAIFDEEEEGYDEALLDKYLFMLDEKQLYEYMAVIDWKWEILGLFETWPDSFKIRKAIDNSTNKEDVAKINRQSITKDLILAGNMAKALYYSNDSTLVDTYARIASTLKKLFDVDVYNPKAPVLDSIKFDEEKLPF